MVMTFTPHNTSNSSGLRESSLVITETAQSNLSNELAAVTSKLQNSISACFVQFCIGFYCFGYIIHTGDRVCMTL